MAGNPTGYMGSHDATSTTKGIVEFATDAEATAGTRTNLAMTPANVAAVSLSGVSDWAEGTKGVGKLSTDAQAKARTNDDTAMTPLKVAAQLTTPGAIGGTTAGSGAFTGLTADGTGTVTLTSNAASVYDVTGATNDLTLSSDGGRIILDSGEDAADSIYIRANAGTSETIRLHADQGTGADSIHLEADAGGITLESGLASEDGINLLATGGGIDMDAALSVVITCTENAADAIQLTATAGGIDIAATGAAGEDIDITNTGGSIRLSATESATDAINIESTAGGVNILASGAAAGEDINVIATGSSVNVTSTEDAASAIYIRANAGTSETIKIHSDQGTGAASLDLLSDVGGITLTSGLASEDAVNISATAGGFDVDAALSIVITGSENAADAIQLTASAGGIDITAAGAAGEDLDLVCTSGSTNISGGEAIANAIVLSAGAGGIDILAPGAGAGLDIDIVNTGGSVNITATESDNAAIKLDATLGGIDILASGAGAGEDIDITATGSSINLTSTESAVDSIKIESTLGGIDILASGAAAGEDIDVIATGSSVNITSTESIATAINLTASTSAGGITMTSGTGNITMAGTINNVAAKYVSPTGLDITLKSNPIMQTAATTGGAATGATGALNLMLLEQGVTMEQFILGAGQTIISPRWGTVGLNIALDLVNNEGAEYNFGAVRTDSPFAYVARTAAAFRFDVTLTVADVSGVEPLWMGFRKAEANNATFTSYTDYAVIGISAATGVDTVSNGARLNSGGAVLEDSGDAFTDGQSHKLSVLVDGSGNVTFEYDDVTLGGSPTAFQFDADTVVPFIHFLHDATTPGTIQIEAIKIGFQ